MSAPESTGSGGWSFMDEGDAGSIIPTTTDTPEEEVEEAPVDGAPQLRGRGARKQNEVTADPADTQWGQEGFKSEASRSLAYVGQEFGRGIASMGDLALNVAQGARVTTDPVNYALEKSRSVLNGDWLPFSYDTPIEDAYKEGISSYYAANNIEVDELKARSASERGVGLLAENLGVFGPLKAGQLGLNAVRNKSEEAARTFIEKYLGKETTKRADDAIGPFGVVERSAPSPVVAREAGEKLPVKLADEFTQVELAAVVGGAVVGGAASSLSRDEDTSEQLAYLGNFLGAVGGAWKYTSTLYHAKKALGAIWKGTDEVTDFSKALVLQDAARILEGADLDDIARRYDILQEIKAKYPDFHPTMYGVVNTPLARHYQTITDADNPEVAQRIYDNNKKVLEAIRRDSSARNLDDTTHPIIQEALAQTKAAGDQVMHTYAARLAKLEDDLGRMGASRATDNLGEVAAEFREQVSVLRTQAREHINDLYRQVDPDNTLIFDTTLTSSIASQALADTLKKSSTRKFNTGADDYSLITDIKDEISTLSPRYEADAFGTMTLVPGTDQITFNKLREVAQNIGNIGRRASNIQGTYQASDYTAEINRHLDAFLDEMMGPDSPLLDGPDYQVAKDMYNTAKSVYKESYLPFFREENSDLRRILQHTSTGEFKVTTDDVLNKFWKTKKGGEEASALKLNKMLEEMTGIVDPEIMSAARDALDITMAEHATALLNRALRNSKDPYSTFKQWVNDNSTNLKNFPAARDVVDEIGENISLLTNERAFLSSQMSEVQKRVFDKYGQVDPERFVDKLIGSTEYEAVTTLRELYFGLGVKGVTDSFPVAGSRESIKDVMANLDAAITALKDTDPQKFAEVTALRQAISKELFSNMLRNSLLNDGSGGISVSRLTQNMEGTKDTYRKNTIDALLTSEDKIQLSKMKVLAEASDMQMTSQGALDFDILRRLEKEFGLTLSSVSSRIYAQQLGKVGPVFIITDTGAKLFRAFHRHNMKDRLREVVYDLEAFETVINTRRRLDQGIEKDIQVQVIKGFKEIRQHITKNAKDLLSGKMNAENFLQGLSEKNFMFTSGFRLNDYLDEMEARDKEWGSRGESHLEHMIDVFLREYESQPDPVSAADYERDVQTALERLNLDQVEDGTTIVIDMDTGESYEEEGDSE